MYSLGDAVRRKLFLLCMVPFALLCSSLVVSVEASSMWSQTYGGTGDEAARSVVATSDGGYAIAGYTYSFGAGGYGYCNFWLVKTDENGDVPEYSSRVIPILVLTAALFIIINKKKRSHTCPQVS
jgi:hypothetical protein